MGVRVVISVLALGLRSSANCDGTEQCSVNEEESVSTLQVQHDVMNVSNADCVQFYTHDCGLQQTETPSKIEDMRDAFVQCCIDNGKYHRDVCQPFMEQIFEGHRQPSALLCSKLSNARSEHHRFVQLLQRKVHGDINNTVSISELDMAVGKKLGFAPAQKDFACAEGWEKRLKRATRESNVRHCMHKCEFAPECEAISFMDNKCVMCGTSTMAYRPGWSTYVKRGTTGEARPHCRNNRDCDYPGCNTPHWKSECLMPENKNGRCVHFDRYSSVCKHHANDEMPVPGHWCLNEHFYRLCPKDDASK